MTAATECVPVSSEAELRDLLGSRGPVRDQGAPRLHSGTGSGWPRRPFCLIATADADAALTCHRRGTRRVHLHHRRPDDRRPRPGPGNRRADGSATSWQPVRGHDLPGTVARRHAAHQRAGPAAARRAVFDEMIVEGNRPRLALSSTSETIFFHCARRSCVRTVAVRRRGTRVLPPHATIVKDRHGTRRETLEELQRHYGPSYENLLLLTGAAPRNA